MLTFLILYPSVALTLPLILALAVRWSIVLADRKRTEWLLVAGCFAVPLGAVAEGIANALSTLRPLKYDLYVYRIDALFGQPSFHLGNLVYHHRALMILVSISYGVLPMVLFAVFALHLYLRHDAVQVLKAFVLNMLAAVPLYLLFPVCGPAFAFAHFPQSPGAILAEPIAIHAAPNGVPSVHTSSALLILYFLWPWKWGRVFGFVFLALTVFATLGSGQHYCFDLLCAVPYAAAVYRATSPKRSAVTVTQQPLANTAA